MDIANIIGEATDYERKRQLDTDKPKTWCKSVSAFYSTYNDFVLTLYNLNYKVENGKDVLA